MWVRANTHYANYTPDGKVAGSEGEGVTVTFDLFCHADTPTISWFAKLQPCAPALLHYPGPRNTHTHSHTHTLHFSFSHR